MIRSSKSHISLLLVEDDENLNAAVVDALTAQGYAVNSIDCAEALSELPNLLGVDLAVVDVNLPGEDGLSLVRRLRSIQPTIGLIIMSARSTAEDRSAGYEAGADIYLTKPIHLGELVEAISALERRLWPDRDLADHLFCLDVDRLALQGRSCEVFLSQKECDLLRDWISAPQKTLSHTEVAAVLELNLDEQKQLIELQISRLRKKISKALDEKNCLRAVRGYGYQLCVSLRLV